MKLDDFLKCKKVRLLTDGYTNLNKGSEYNLVRLEVVISNNAGIEGRYPLDDFEPVLDAAETPLQNIELTPEFEAAEPKFKVGDKVYVGLTGKIAQVMKIIDDNVVNVANKNNEVRAWISNICHATQENYALLSKLYPHIEFEAPPKELKGSDLTRAMLDKGWKFVPCFTSRYSEEDALDNPLDNSLNNIDLIIGTERGYFLSVWGDLNEFAVPFDFKKGEPLTESILND